MTSRTLAGAAMILLTCDILIIGLGAVFQFVSDGNGLSLGIVLSAGWWWERGILLLRRFA